MKKNYFSADTPLSALFRRTFHDDLRQVIDSWRPALVGCPPDADALALTHFWFDRRQLHAKRVYMDLIGLMERGALRPSLHALADYLYDHSNLSRSPSTLYQLLSRCRWNVNSVVGHAEMIVTEGRRGRCSARASLPFGLFIIRKNLAE